MKLFNLASSQDSLSRSICECDRKLVTILVSSESSNVGYDTSNCSFAGHSDSSGAESQTGGSGTEGNGTQSGQNSGSESIGKPNSGNVSLTIFEEARNRHAVNGIRSSLNSTIQLHRAVLLMVFIQLVLVR